MDVKERLIELLAEHCPHKEKRCVGCNPGKHYHPECKVEQFGKVADHLIDNGVTVQEDCKSCAEATQTCVVKLQEQIAELRSVQEWIPVTERLPEMKHEPYNVLVCHDVKGTMIMDCAWYSHCKQRWCSFNGMKLKVTHWMPLPELPKE